MRPPGLISGKCRSQNECPSAMFLVKWIACSRLKIKKKKHKHYFWGVRISSDLDTYLTLLYIRLHYDCEWIIRRPEPSTIDIPSGSLEKHLFFILVNTPFSQIWQVPESWLRPKPLNSKQTAVLGIFFSANTSGGDVEHGRVPISKLPVASEGH